MTYRMTITVTVNTPNDEYEFDFEGTPDQAMIEGVKRYPNATSMVLVFTLG